MKSKVSEDLLQTFLSLLLLFTILIIVYHKLNEYKNGRRKAKEKKEGDEAKICFKYLLLLFYYMLMI